MDDALHAALARWTNFYLITGTAAAALTGLQFVVQTLLASDLRGGASSGDPEGGINAFGTPTVVHFTAALLLSALLCIPWPGFGSLRATLAALGVATLAYSVVVMGRARRQQGYVPVFEDWLWHVLLPIAAYGAVLVTAVVLGPGAEWPMFLVAFATLLLICVGIHNAWDTVTYLTIASLRAGAPGESEPAPANRKRSNAKGRRRR